MALQVPEREGRGLVPHRGGEYANYISLYICANDDKGYVPERYKKALPKAKIGKSCVRFKKLSDLDAAILSRMIREGAGAPPQA